MANGRCRFHGGKVGVRTQQAQRNANEAATQGWRDWYKRHNNDGAWDDYWFHRKRDTGAKQRIMARKIIVAELEKLPTPTEKPFHEQTMGEMLTTAARASLVEAMRIINLDHETTDPETGEVHRDLKLLAIRKDVVIGVLKLQMRADESALRRKGEDRLPDLIRRLDAIDAEIVSLDNTEPQLIPIQGFE